MTRLGVTGSLLVVIVGCADAPPTASISPSAAISAAPALEGDVRPDTVLNRYIVVLRDDVPSAAEAFAALVQQAGGLGFYVYDTALKGFAIANLPPGAAEAPRRHPLVVLVEEDRILRAHETTQNVGALADSGLYRLDRIDQRSLPRDGGYTYAADGSGVHIYIIDSGVNGGHQEWSGRTGNGAAFIQWSSDPSPYNDSQGHGTSVAGAAAGSRVGVAKGATLHSVRIDDGDAGAYTSDIVAGIDWVAAHRILPAAANLSYERGAQPAATAVSGLIGAGVTFVTAAGNDAADACNATTQLSGVVTVGATVANDRRASYSNIGPCLDMFAPGGDLGGLQNGAGPVEPASKDGDAVYRWSRGTSYAAPVAAGVAALILQRNGTLSPGSVASLMVQHASTNVVVDPGTGSPNRLLYSRIDVTAPPPPPPNLPEITGPDWVRPSSNCLGMVTPGDAVLRVTYARLVNSVTQSETSESFRYSAGVSSFTLEVWVTDANNVVWYSDPFFVDVSQEAPECLDQ